MLSFESTRQVPLAAAKRLQYDVESRLPRVPFDRRVGGTAPRAFVLLPDGEIVDYTYNAQLLLASKAIRNGPPIAKDITYNALGRPVQIRLANARSDLYLRTGTRRWTRASRPMGRCGTSGWSWPAATCCASSTTTTPRAT